MQARPPPPPASTPPSGKQCAPTPAGACSGAAPWAGVSSHRLSDKHSCLTVVPRSPVAPSSRALAPRPPPPLPPCSAGEQKVTCDVWDEGVGGWDMPRTAQEWSEWRGGWRAGPFAPRSHSSKGGGLARALPLLLLLFRSAGHLALLFIHCINSPLNRRTAAAGTRPEPHLVDLFLPSPLLLFSHHPLTRSGQGHPPAQSLRHLSVHQADLRRPPRRRQGTPRRANRCRRSTRPCHCRRRCRCPFCCTCCGVTCNAVLTLHHSCLTRTLPRRAAGRQGRRAAGRELGVCPV